MNSVEKIIEKCRPVENKLTNGNKGKSVDFCVADISDKKNYLVEVLNVHIDDGNPDIVKLKKKLRRKVKVKSKNKTQGTEFIVVPVLWAAKNKTLVTLEHQINEWKNFQIEGVFEPFAFFTFTDEQGRIVFKFNRISTLF